jgi:hypothetical protein
MKMIILDLLIINIEVNRIISAHSRIYDKTKWYERERQEVFMRDMRN